MSKPWLRESPYSLVHAFPDEVFNLINIGYSTTDDINDNTITFKLKRSTTSPFSNRSAKCSFNLASSATDKKIYFIVVRSVTVPGWKQEAKSIHRHWVHRWWPCLDPRTWRDWLEGERSPWVSRSVPFSTKFTSMMFGTAKIELYPSIKARMTVNLPMRSKEGSTNHDDSEQKKALPHWIAAAVRDSDDLFVTNGAIFQVITLIPDLRGLEVIWTQTIYHVVRRMLKIWDHEAIVPIVLLNPEKKWA